MGHLLLIPLVAALIGCASDRRTDMEVRTDASPSAELDADDNIQAEAAGQPSAKENDRILTVRVRENLSSDATLGTAAERVTVTAQDGVVTLNGVVNSEAEKNSLANKAQGVNGVNKVNNRLEVAANRPAADANPDNR